MDYSSSFLTSASPAIIFNAITKEIDKWWGRVDKPVDKIGDEFSIYFGETEWRFKIATYLQNEQVTWHCIKANHVHDGLQDIQKEWLNTTVDWEIQRKTGRTEITLTHNGLNKDLNCYEVCEAGWDYYLRTSLRNYLDNGNGTPFSG